MQRLSPSRLLLTAIFFFSGSAGLVYEIIWTRMLLLIFGTTTHSVVAVTSAFMAGLALGSYLAGRIVTKKYNMLRVYGMIELTIGGASLATLLLFRLVTVLYTLLYHVIPSPTVLLFVKFLLTFAALLPPTIAMGATLPVMVQFFQEHFSGTLSKDVGRLYAVNTFGALVGVLITGFILIERIGLLESSLVAASVNIAIGLFVLSLARQKVKVASARTIPEESLATRPPYTRDRRNLALAVFAISGLVSMAYEIAWTRLLTPTTGTYIYAFSAMLALFLLGIALGSALYQWLLTKVPAALLLLGIVELGIGLGAFFSVLATSYLFSFSRVATVLAVILPATIAMGMTFPIVTTLSPRKETGTAFVATSYALNTVGSMIGPLVAGFLLLPLFGTTRTILLLACLNFIFAGALILAEKEKVRYRLRPILVGTSVLAALFLVFLGVTNSEILLEKSLRSHLAAFAQGGYRWAYAEDETAAVLAYNTPDRHDYGLLVDGVGMSVLVDETKLMAHIPLLLHPNPKDALVICFGMGTTFRSALTYGINVDAVELVPSVVSMFPIFFSDAKEVAAKPRGRIIVNDGRNYVRLTSKKYDLITVDPPPPVNSAGTTVLYAREFYRDAKRILNSGGLFTQWLFYGTRTDDFRMLVRSFTDVFPYVAVFHSPRGIGIYLIGSDKPIILDRKRFQERLRYPEVSADINEWGTWNADNLLSLYFGDRSLLTKFAGNALPVTDNNPRTEYFLLRHATTKADIARDEVVAGLWK